MADHNSFNMKPLPESDRLKGKENWRPFSMQFKAILRRIKALSIAEGTSTKPELTGKEQDAWDNLSSEALLLLQLSIAPSQLWRIEGANTIFDAWSRLSKAFEPRTRA